MGMRSTGLVLACCFWALCSPARLGESPLQCDQRYGEVLGQRNLANQRGFEKVYERGPYLIFVRFVPTLRTSYQGYEAGYLQFRRLDDKPISDEIAEILLEKNRQDPILRARLGPNIQWEEESPADRNLSGQWKRVYFYDQRIGGRTEEQKADAGAVANLSRDGVLTLSSHFDLPEGYRNRADRREVEDEPYDPAPPETETRPRSQRARD
jgi:hypothetical protein